MVNEEEIKREQEETDEKPKQNISVKGVRKDLYDKVLKFTRESGKTLGDITNEAYRGFLATVEGAKHLSRNFVEGAIRGDIKYIENIKNLTIDKRDFDELNVKVAFKNIDTLTFAGISTEDLTKYVETISNVKTIVIPRGVSKAALLLRSTYVDEIITKE